MKCNRIVDNRRLLFHLFRYDYLVFTDAKGQQMKFDQKVGTGRWPKQVQFIGPHLHFLFHSDSSNTEWGYKFKVSLDKNSSSDHNFIFSSIQTVVILSGDTSLR